MNNAEVFSYGGGESMWMPPGAMMPAPPGTMWQLVPVETPKSKEKSEKEKQEGGQEKKQTPGKQDKQGKQPKFDLKVSMCCAKCAEKVKEEIFEVPGVVDVQTDVATSIVTVFGKPEDPFLVLRKARKVNKKAEFIGDPLAEQKKSEAVKSEKKLDPKSKPEDAITASEASPLLSTTYRNYYTAKPSIAPYYGMPYYAPDHHQYSSTYRPSQSYPPNHYPQYLETDYSNYYPNPNYITHIKSSY